MPLHAIARRADCRFSRHWLGAEALLLPIEGVSVRPEAMRRNLEAAGGAMLSEAVMMRSGELRRRDRGVRGCRSGARGLKGGGWWS